MDDIGKHVDDLIFQHFRQHPAVVRAYGGDAAVAMAIAEHICVTRNLRFALWSDSDRWIAEFCGSGNVTEGYGQASYAAEAICLAALDVLDVDPALD